MKVFGVAMVRNEADIVEAFVRHNLTVLDGLAIVDHGSFDGTSEILASLVAEGLPITVARSEVLGQHQSEITTWVVRDVLRQTSADFVFAIDADEFICVRSRGLLDQVLSQLPPGLPALVDWQTYVPDFANATPEDDVRHRIAGAKRVAQERHGLHKVVIARDFASTPALVAPGNHSVLPSTGPTTPGQSNPHAKLSPTVVHLAHVPVRSHDQFIAKVAIGWLATVVAHKNRTVANYHWRDIFADLVAGEELTPQKLTKIAANYSLPKDNWQPIEAVDFVAAPFLAEFELRYVHRSRAAPLALVLAFAEKLALR